MAEISTNQFKNGSHIEADGTIWKIVDFQHVKPGKGGAFVRTKLRRVEDGAVVDKTFRAGEKFRQVRTETKRMQYLYNSGDSAVFMDAETYDQLELPRDSIADEMQWVVPNEHVELLLVDERPSGIQVASAVDMAVSQTDPGLKGDTASGGGTKPATLESGVVVQVPLFVNEGDRVRVDTRSRRVRLPRVSRHASGTPARRPARPSAPRSAHARRKASECRPPPATRLSRGSGWSRARGRAVGSRVNGGAARARHDAAARSNGASGAATFTASTAGSGRSVIPTRPGRGGCSPRSRRVAQSALLSHYSANELCGFVDRLERRPDVTVTTGSHRAPRRIKVHRTAALADIDRRELLGIPVTSPARALLELASMLDTRRTRAAIRRALGTGKVTVRQLGLALERYPGRRGARTVREAVKHGADPTKSDGESDVLDIILAGGIAHPDVNRPLVLEGRRLIPDFRWPAQQLILEVDSKAWHTDPLARADDAERQSLLEAYGETVLRVDWTDAVLAPGKLCRMLEKAGAPRRAG